MATVSSTSSTREKPEIAERSEDTELEPTRAARARSAGRFRSLRSGAQGLEPTSWFVAVLFTATDVSYLDRFYATRTCQAFIRDPVAQRDVMRGEVSGTSLVNIYVATGVGALSPVAACAKPLVYVPNSRSETVTVIDPTTHTVLRRFSTGRLPQHVVPSYDKSRLWL